MQKANIFPSLLLAFTSVLYLYLHASLIASPGEIVRPLLALWFALLFVSLPIYWLVRDWAWVGILLLIIVLGFFSSSLFASFFSITILSSVLLLWGIYRLLNRNLGLNHIFIVANITSFIVIIILFVNIIYPKFTTIPISYYSNYMDLINSKNPVVLSQSANAKPDIYYIVLDGYGRTDVLQELYGYNNSKFVNYLKHRGFTVPDNSHSNYPKTALSVTSTLNMDYVDVFAPGLAGADFWWLMSPWLDHNRVRTSLEKIGYISVSVSTDWSITDNPTTDVYFNSHPIMLTDFERYLLGITPLRLFQSWFENIASVSTFNMHRRTLLNDFDALIASTRIPGPKFVFAHIILPHPPFVFSSNGSPITPDYFFSFNDASDYRGTDLQYRDQYIGQVQFLNSKLEPVIESILQNSKYPPMIILQADHGPGMLTDFTSFTNTCLMERFSNFSAYYLPMARQSVIPDNITPVNLFRIIFDEYFDANLPLLENAYYYPKQAVMIYDLVDVTPFMDGRQNCVLK